MAVQTCLTIILTLPFAYRIRVSPRCKVREEVWWKIILAAAVTFYKFEKLRTQSKVFSKRNITYLKKSSIRNIRTSKIHQSIFFHFLQTGCEVFFNNVLRPLLLWKKIKKPKCKGRPLKMLILAEVMLSVYA